MTGMLDKLGGRAAKIQARLDELEKAADSRAGDDAGVFTDDERAEYDRLVAELKTLARDKERIEARIATATTDWMNRRKVTAPGAFADGEAAEFDDGARIVSGENPNGPFKTFGEQLAAIAASSKPGSVVDERLARLAAASGASATVGADGGFLIQKDFTLSLLEKAEEKAVLWTECDRIPIGDNSDGLEAPIIDETSRATGSRWGGVQVYRKSEAATVTAKQPKFAKFSLDLEDLMGLMYATDRLIRDASALGAIADRAFSSEMAFTVDDEIIRGTGAGQALGILNSGALVSQAKETSQTAATVNATNIAKMYSRMPAGLIPGAKWYLNTDVLPQLLTMTLGDQPIYVPGGRFNDYPYGMLLGRPVVPIEQAETLGTVGDVIFANFMEYAVIEKDGIQSAESMHVRFLYNERTFRWVLRINGAPKWKSSQTPYRGSATKSPFVVLATRA